MRVSCHCNNIQIDVALPARVTQCNCSICSRYSALWGYYAPDEPSITVGELGVHQYSWGDHELAFVRCANCGCVTHYVTAEGLPDPKVAVNFGLARDAVSEIPVRYFNGAEKL